MGKSSAPCIGYWYGMTIHMIECLQGEVLYEVRAGDRTAWSGALTGSGSITINQPNLFGGEKSEGGVVGTLEVMAGDAAQMPNATVMSIESGPHPAYRGLLGTVFRGDLGAMNKYVKAWSKKWGRWTGGWSTPVWQPALCKIDQGMNPAHIIYQIMTDPNCGGRDPASTFDLVKMQAAAQTLYDEGMGLCLKWTTADSIGAFTKIICDHVGAMWVEDPTQAPGVGSAYLKLIRADYDPATLPVLDESNIMQLLSYQQATLGNGVNEVTVNYHDPATNKDVFVTAQSLASVQAQGRVISQTNTYPGLWNHDQAARAAMRDCNIASSLLLRIKVKVKSGGPNGQWGVKKGDVLSFSWARKNLVSMPMRVLEADYGTVTDNAITLTCVQDVFGLPATTYLVSQPPLWTAPDLTPQPVPNQVIMEASYRDLASHLSAGDLAALDSAAGYLTTLGSRPTSVAQNYTLKARIGSSGNFLEVGAGQFPPNGTLTADIGPTDTAIFLTAATALDQVSTGTEAILGSEIVRVDAINAGTGAVTIGRGCVDTVPAAHTAGTRLWFTDRYTGYGKTEYITGEQIQCVLLTNTGLGQLDPSLATIGSVTMASRQARPYPPGNLKINGNRYPASDSGSLVLTWSHRDRLLSADQLVDTLQTDIGPEPGTTYTVRVYVGGTLDSTTTGITATTTTPTISAGGIVRIEIDAVRSGMSSWQSLTATLAYTKVTLALTGDAPNGTPGTAYSYSYTAGGGVPPYTFSILSGALNTGITLNTGTGVISGSSPPASTASWVIRVTDSASNHVDLSDSATIAYATLTLSGTYAAATVGTAYSSDLTIAGGNGTYSNARATVGSVPAGLSLSIVSGKLRLSGTPTGTAGTVNFTAAVDSGDGQTATSAQSVSVSSGIVLAVWDSAKKTSHVTLTGSNLTATLNAAVSGYTTFGGTTGKSSGKWAFTIKVPSNNDAYAGIGGTISGDAGTPWTEPFKPSDTATGKGESIAYTFYSSAMRYTSEKMNSSSSSAASGGAVAGSTVVTFLVDLSSSPQTIKLYNGNTLIISYNIPAGMAGATWYPLASGLSNAQAFILNAGQTTITIPTPEAANGYNAYWG